MSKNTLKRLLLQLLIWVKILLISLLCQADDEEIANSLQSSLSNRHSILSQTYATIAGSSISTSGNTAIVYQIGQDNYAQITQVGRGNSASISQIGNNNNATISQNGTGNQAVVNQTGNNQALSLSQTGNGLSASVISR